MKCRILGVNVYDLDVSVDAMVFECTVPLRDEYIGFVVSPVEAIHDGPLWLVVILPVACYGLLLFGD